MGFMSCSHVLNIHVVAFLNEIHYTYNMYNIVNIGTNMNTFLFFGICFIVLTTIEPNWFVNS